MPVENPPMVGISLKTKAEPLLPPLTFYDLRDHATLAVGSTTPMRRLRRQVQTGEGMDVLVCSCLRAMLFP